jgi:hypothetical protein
VAAAAALAAACSQPARTPKSTLLVGAWNADFRYGAATRVVSTWGTPIRGRVVFAPAARRVGCPAGRIVQGVVCASVVHGSHGVGFAAVLGPSGADRPSADGAMEEGGRILLRLGGCCDADEVVAGGCLRADGTIAGRWSRERLGDLPGGTFVLRRAVR